MLNAVVRRGADAVPGPCVPAGVDDEARHQATPPGIALAAGEDDPREAPVRTTSQDGVNLSATPSTDPTTKKGAAGLEEETRQCRAIATSSLSPNRPRSSTLATICSANLSVEGGSGRSGLAGAIRSLPCEYADAFWMGTLSNSPSAATMSRRSSETGEAPEFTAVKPPFGARRRCRPRLGPPVAHIEARSCRKSGAPSPAMGAGFLPESRTRRTD